MNKDEKRVLRRKRFLIASHMKLTDSLMEELVALPLMTSQGREQVKGEQGNTAKVERWLELLPHIDRKQTFIALCDFLEKHQGWLADDLRVDLKAEKAGAGFRVDDTIRREAEALVQRDFGNSRRLSEFDKRDIKTLVACRMQITKDVWRRQCEKIQNSLKDETKLKINFKDKSQDIISRISGFLRINRGLLRGNACLKDTAKEEEETLTDGVCGDRTVASQLCDSVQELLDVSGQCFLELEQLQQEKRRSMQIISVEDETLKLNIQLEMAMEKIEEDTRELQRNIEYRDNQIQSLKDEITRKENKAVEDDQSHNREVKNLKRHLNTSHEKIRDLDVTIERLERDLMETKEDLGRTRNKSDLLEKSRRLGFLSEGKRPSTDKMELGVGTKAGRTPFSGRTQGTNKKSPRSATKKI